MIIPAPGRFNLETYLKTLTSHKCTWGHIAPPVAVALRNTPLLNPSNPSSKDIDLSSVKGFMSGGGEFMCRAHHPFASSPPLA